MLGHRVMAPSTIGTFLRAFTFGHVRQLDRLTEQLLGRAWAAGAGPGGGPMTIDLDSTICQVHGYHKQGAAYGYTHTLGCHPLVATRADSGEVLHARQRTGRANTARGTTRFVDELAARVRRAGASGELTMRADSGFWSAKAHVIAADTSDRDGAVGLLGRLDRRRFPRLRHGRADQGYRGPFLGHVRQTFKISLEVVGVPMVGGVVAGCRLGPSRRWCLPLR